MPFCPNCGQSIQIDLKTCPECSASFESGSVWRPVETPIVAANFERKERVKEPVHEGELVFDWIRSKVNKAMIFGFVGAVSATILMIGLYLISLFTPAFLFSNGDPKSGLEVLQIGWLGILMLDPRWYANVLFAVLCLANIFLSQWRVTAAFALALGVGSLLFPVYWYQSEAGGQLVHSLGIGGYAWVTAVCFAALINLFLRKQNGA